jgi:hypothetical protein
MLVEHHHAQVGRGVDPAGIGRVEAGEQAQERGLAAAVRAQQAQPQAWREHQVEVAQHHPGAEALAEAFRHQQAPGLAVRAGEVDGHALCPRARVEVR